MSNSKDNIDSSRNVTLEAVDINLQSPNANMGSTSESSERSKKYDRIRENETMKTLWRVVSWTPKRCRWDPENPPRFTLALNLLFGFVSQHLLIIY